MLRVYFERSHRNFEKGKILYRTFFGKSLEREKCGGREAFSNCRRGIFLDDRFHGIDLTIVCRVSSRVTLVFHVGATFSCCDDAFSSRSFHRLKSDLQLIPNNLLKGNIRYVTRFVDSFSLQPLFFTNRSNNARLPGFLFQKLTFPSSLNI